MRSPRSRAVRAAAAAITAATAMALFALSAPAFAEDPEPSDAPSSPAPADPSTSPGDDDGPGGEPVNKGADLSVKLRSTQSTPAGSDWMTKVLVVTVENDGPEKATGVTVTFTVEDYDYDGKRYRLEPGIPCNTKDAGGDRTYTCFLGGQDSTLAAGGTSNEIYLEFRHKVNQVGDVAEGTVGVASKVTDPDMKNNSQPYTVSIVNAGVDVSAYMAGDVTIKPGETVSLFGGDFVQVFNEGRTPVDGISMSLTLPAYASFEKDYSSCQYEKDGRKANCDFDVQLEGNQDGMEFTAEEPVRITLAKNAPGPLSLGRGTVTVAALGILQPQAFKGTGNVQNLGKAAPQDQAPGDNSIEYAVFSTENPADLSIAASSPEGKVGSEVSVDVTVGNNGPADSPGGALVTFTPPTGTTVVKAPSDCAKKDPAAVVWICETDATVPVGAKNKGVFKLKIDSKDLKDGKVTVESRFADTDLKNNEAKVTVGIGGGGGGLPVTGTSLTIAGVAAAALLVIGGALLLASRKRRAATAGGVDVAEPVEPAAPEAKAEPETKAEPEAKVEAESTEDEGEAEDTGDKKDDGK